MKIRIDGQLCAGHGRCYSLAPDVFAPDDEGYAAGRDVERQVAPGSGRTARVGVSSCPEAAIAIVED